MTAWVLDTSVALAWAMPDEGSARADALWHDVETGAALYVPSLWWYECANAVVVAERRQRISGHQAAALLGLLSELPLTTTAPLIGEDLTRIVALARRHDLSAYDASYLELANRNHAGLATLDTCLHTAAQNEGIPILEP